MEKLEQVYPQVREKQLAKEAVDYICDSKNKRARRKNRIKCPDSLTTRPAAEYYREKRPDYTSMSINSLLQTGQWELHNDRTLQSIRDYC